MIKFLNKDNNLRILIKNKTHKINFNIVKNNINNKKSMNKANMNNNKIYLKMKGKFKKLINDFFNFI